MTDTTTLSYDDLERIGLADWRFMLRTLRARFTTADFASALALVDRIGEAADAADHHPEIALSYGEVRVTLSSHDAGGVTERDVELARRISELAAEAGAASEPAGIAVLELGLDTADEAPMSSFYAALLGLDADEDRGEVADPVRQMPTLWWQTPVRPEDRSRDELPEPEVEQRWHLDVTVPVEVAEARLQAVLAAGGRLVSDAAAPAFWVVEDADGNRSCICTSAGRS